MRFGDRGNKYKKITREQRLKIIDLIIQQKMSIKGAAQAVGLGASTARMILRKYQRNGSIFQSKKKFKDQQITEGNFSEKSDNIICPSNEIIPQNMVPMYYFVYNHYGIPMIIQNTL